VKELNSSGQKLSVQLINYLRKNNLNDKVVDSACKAIYGKTNEKTKKNFFQLAHHTFKLINIIHKKYPYYLTENLSAIEQLHFSQKKSEALFHANVLYDISEKTEDFFTLTKVSKYLANNSFLHENKNETIKYLDVSEKALICEREILSITKYIRENLNYKDKSTYTKPDKKKHISFFTKHINHQSVSIKLFGIYGICYTYSFLNDPDFYSEETLKHLITLKNEIEKHSYILFPYPTEVFLNIDFMYIKHLLRSMNEHDLQKESMLIINKWGKENSWSNYVNNPVIVSLSIQASYYITNYCLFYHPEYQKIVPANVFKQIAFLKKTCNDILNNTDWEKEGYYARYINLCNIYCCCLLFGNNEDQLKCIKTIEGLLVKFQQISFQKMYDNLFTTLIIAYFSQKNYDKVADSYLRYEKLTKKLSVNRENDIAIRAFYFASQWIDTGRKQYKQKFTSLMLDVKDKKMTGTLKILTELSKYSRIKG
jgi:hypothetical protein